MINCQNVITDINIIFLFICYILELNFVDSDKHIFHTA